MNIKVHSFITDGDLAIVSGLNEMNEPAIAGMTIEVFSDFKKQYSHLCMPFWAKIDKSKITPISIN